MADGNGVGWERTQRTVGAANGSRMWNSLHEVLLDRDKRLQLMRSPMCSPPLLHHSSSFKQPDWKTLASGLWLQVVLVLKWVHTWLFHLAGFSWLSLKWPLEPNVGGSTSTSETAKMERQKRARGRLAEPQTLVIAHTCGWWDCLSGTSPTALFFK